MNALVRRALVRRALKGGIDAADAGHLLARALTAAFPPGTEHFPRPAGLLAAGKAAARMTEVFLERFEERLWRGVIAAPSAVAGWPTLVRAYAAGHPRPTAASIRAAEDALALGRGLAADQDLVVLLSGGASALLALPAPPVTLEDKAAVTSLLLEHGVPIDGLNCVRKHLSMGFLLTATQAPRLSILVGRV